MAYPGLGRGVGLGLSQRQKVAKYLRHNFEWLRSKMEAGYVVVDIGPDFPNRRRGYRKGLSYYYFME
jgi:hypothetical protein